MRIVLIENMKSYISLLAITLAFAGTTQIMNAEDKDPQVEDKKVLGLELGAKIPELDVTNQMGKEVSFEAEKGHKWVFIFFYPKALTGG